MWLLMKERALAAGMFVYIETASAVKRNVLGESDVCQHLFQFVAAFKVSRTAVSEEL
jgi:hypothetical protein